MDLDRTDEKNPANIEAQVDSVSTSDDVTEDEDFTEADAKSIIRRVDIRVVGVCALGYSVSLMDRTNVGYAAIAG